jgi:hypothetical protein
MAAARDSIVGDDQVICRPAEALIVGEWEKNPKSPRADYVRLMDESMRALAQPI